MCEELRLLHNRIDATTVYVTHDQIEAMSMADRIAVMNHAEVLQIGPPAEIYSRPASVFVANFIGSPAMNFLPASGHKGAGTDELRVNGARLPVPELNEEPQSEEVILGVRPEHISIDDGGPLRGRVFGVEYMGTRQLVTVDTDAGRLKIRADNRLRLNDGENIGLSFDTQRLVLFDGKTERALRSGDLGGIKDG